MRRFATFALGMAAVALVAAGSVMAQAPDRPFRAIAPGIAGDRLPSPPQPPPTSRPQPFKGPIASLSFDSAGISSASIEEGDTHFEGAREYLDDPSGPQQVMWYPRFGRPGSPSANTILAAHVNYAGAGPGPFARLQDAPMGDTLYLTMANGDIHSFAVQHVVVVPLATLNMDEVVYPALDEFTERVTLISCGGTFIPSSAGGGYDSRVILVAERRYD